MKNYETIWYNMPNRSSSTAISLLQFWHVNMGHRLAKHEEHLKARTRSVNSSPITSESPACLCVFEQLSCFGHSLCTIAWDTRSVPEISRHCCNLSSVSAMCQQVLLLLCEGQPMTQCLCLSFDTTKHRWTDLSSIQNYVFIFLNDILLTLDSSVSLDLHLYVGSEVLHEFADLIFFVLKQ